MDTSLYKNDEYVCSELCRVRLLWSDKEKFTHELSDILTKGLALMLFYCSDEMSGLVEQHLRELTIRSSYISPIKIK